ncbi:pitrilysin family protein [Bdellovibrionota bacterium FG-1]
MKPIHTLLITGIFAALWILPQARAIEVSFEDDNSLPVVYLNVAVKAGSVTDPMGKSGLSNFMGEMLLRGTRSRTKEQIDLALDQMGARLEVEVRAEALILRGAVLSRQFVPFTQLLAEIVTEPSFPENEIRKLKAEITSGILEELGHDPTLSSRRFTEFLFREHPYGKPVLGKVKDVEHFSREDISRHYDKLFRDVNLLVVGTGAAQSAEIQTFANVLSKARSGKSPYGAIIKVLPPQDSPSRRLLMIDKPDRTQTQINAGQIGVRMTDPDFFALHLGNYAFGGGSFSARMMVEIRVKRGWSYGANSYFRQGLQPRSWQMHVFPAEKDTAPALALMLKMAKELGDQGITLEEFNFAQRSLVNSAGFMYNTPRKRVENRLLERTLDLPEGFMKSYGPALQKVKFEQVNAALKHFLKPEKLAIAVLGTAKNLKEPLAQAAGIAVDQVVVVPYTQE